MAPDPLAAAAALRTRLGAHLQSPLGEQVLELLLTVPKETSLRTSERATSRSDIHEPVRGLLGYVSGAPTSVAFQAGH